MRASTVITSLVALTFVSTASALPPDEYVSGLLHQPLGDITTFTVDGRTLTACCIGSSGEDGVEVRFDSLHGGGASVDIEPLLGATGLSREIRVRPKGWDGTIKGTMRITSDPDGVITEEYDFTTSGVTAMEWRLRDAFGNVLASGTELGAVLTWGLELSAAPGATVDKRFAVSQSASGKRDASQGFFDIAAVVTGLTPFPVPGVQNIEVVPICAGCPNNPLEDLQAFEVTADGIPDLVVTDAHLRTFGVESWGLGQAHLAEECIGMPPPCAGSEVGLVADNLGSSGQDGVGIDFGPGANGGSVSKEKCRGCGNGHVTLMKLYDDEAQEVGRVAETSGTGIPSGSLAPDFSAIGSVEFDVAYIGTDGTALAVERCSNGTPLEVPEPHVHCPTDVSYEWKVEEGEKVVLEASLCAPSGSLTLPSGAGVSGVAALRIRPVEPTGVHHTVSRLEFTSSNATDIVIHHASASKPVYVSGLPHHLLGEVSSHSVDGRTLTACCLGSSGEDGVELRLDSVHGGGASVDISSLLGATGLQREMRIRPRGWDGTIKGHMRITSDPGGVITEEYDFTTSGVTEMQWRLLNVHGGVLAEGVEPGGVLAWGLEVPDTGVACNKLYAFGETASAARSAEQGFFDRVVSVSGLTPDPVSGVQMIEVVPVPCAGCPNSPLEDLRSVDFTGDGMLDIVVSSARIRVTAVDAWGNGDAHIREECRDPLETCDDADRVLVVENLGSSGQDGVTLDFGPDSIGGLVVSVPGCRAPCVPGHTTLTKLYDDDSNETFRLTQSDNPMAGQVDVTVDAAGQGAFQVQATLSDGNGDPLAAVLLDPLTTISYFECSEVQQPQTIEVKDTYVFTVECVFADYVVPGVGIVPGVASVEFEPVGASSRRASRFVEITSNDPGGMVIESASATPVTIGDVDRDGDLDLVDYAIFAECMAGAKVAFAPPGQCSSTHFRQCDLDKDVDVDLGDFAEFQVAFPGD